MKGWIDIEQHFDCFTACAGRYSAVDIFVHEAA
jgi:hypothetical protein